MAVLRVLGKFLFNVAVWLDEGLSTLTGGSPNETVSERAAKARNNGRKWGCVLCKILDKLSPGHCDRALQETIGDDAIIPDGD